IRSSSSVLSSGLGALGSSGCRCSRIREEEKRTGFAVDTSERLLTNSASRSSALSGGLTSKPEPEEACFIACCCTTCVSSCASRRCPAAELGAYWSAPKTTLGPTVYACAFTARADSAARASLCTRTWLKSWPKRDSIRVRGLGSSGLPVERKTSCTMGGAGAWLDVFNRRRCNVKSFFSHSAHSLPPPCCRHAQLR